VNRYREDFLELLRDDVDIVFANKREAEILYGCESAEACAAQLGEHVSVAAMKVGKDGSIVIYDGKQELAASRPILATDSTGAGDMYAAGFLAAYAMGRSPVEAARAGGHLAEEIIQRVGAQFTVDDLPYVKDQMKGHLQ
jgi:sugar/nucleoside kinase (ribokinase family)